MEEHTVTRRLQTQALSEAGQRVPSSVWLYDLGGIWSCGKKKRIPQKVFPRFLHAPNFEQEMLSFWPRRLGLELQT